jgi:lysozyme
MPIPQDMFDYLHRAVVPEEGHRQFPYDDKTGHTIKLGTGGNVSIGEGRNLSGVGLREDEILYLYTNDANHAWDSLFAALPWAAKLTRQRIRVLFDLAFNMGIDGLLEFKNMLANIEAANYTQAGDELMASKYATQVGTRAENLKKILITSLDPLIDQV